MPIKKVLADNVKRLKEKEGLSNARMAKKCHVANGTIDRALRATGALDIESVTAIAAAFHLQAWQLLVPDLDPSNPFVICTISPEEQALYTRLKAAMKLTT